MFAWKSGRAEEWKKEREREKSNNEERIKIHNESTKCGKASVSWKTLKIQDTLEKWKWNESESKWYRILKKNSFKEAHTPRQIQFKFFDFTAFGIFECPYNVGVSVETNGMVLNISALKLSLSPILIDSNSSNSHVHSSNPPYDRRVAVFSLYLPSNLANEAIRCHQCHYLFSRSLLFLSHSDSFFFLSFFHISTLALNFIVTRVTCFDSNQRSAFDLVFE